MRIRTIKPEFWTHPVLAQLPSDTQLMALALISWSDDHGYFEAEPRQVRGAVMPFRDDLSTIVRDCAELSRVDFIEIRNTERGLIGRVVKFELHQRVEKPKPSKLKAYFDGGTTGCVADSSGTNPGRVPDESREEGKGRDQEEEGDQDQERPPRKSAGKKSKKVETSTPRAPSRIGNLHAFFQEERGYRLTDEPPDGAGLEVAPPDEAPNWALSGVTLGKWIALWPDSPEEEQDRLIKAMMRCWLEEPYWAAPVDKKTGKPSTPYPWGAFLTEGQWRKAFEKLTADEPKAGAA